MSYKMNGKKRKPIVLVIILTISLCINGSLTQAAARNDFLAAIRSVDSRFLAQERITNIEETEIGSPYGETKLVEFRRFETTLGYAIFIDGILVEFAEAPSPFDLFALGGDELFFYDFSGYCSISKENYELIKANQKHNIATLARNEGYQLRASSKTLTGVSPQLQGNYNCIICALSHIITYWRGHGYPALAYGLTFDNLMAALTNRYAVLYGSGAAFANDNVLGLAQSYASFVGAYFSGGANWNPNVSTVYNEIILNYPCMVGFAAGSSYSSTVGHMTMCYGYNYTGMYLYMNLADGHSTSMVTKLWSYYNDCVIVLHPYYFSE